MRVELVDVLLHRFFKAELSGSIVGGSHKLVNVDETIEKGTSQSIYSLLLVGGHILGK